MDPLKRVAITTLILSLVAGYCDTVTFTSAGGTFSAHVTGNFILFAAQVVLGGNSSTWTKLLTFPVFMIAVMMGGRLLQRQFNKNIILLIEGCVLLLAGIIAMFGTIGLLETAVVMLTVFAMGLQNAYNKLCAKEIFGPTTMMTGNVSQAALDIRNLFREADDNHQAVKESLKKQAILICGFLSGCLLGGCISKYFGLISIVLAGIIVIIGYLICKSKNWQQPEPENLMTPEKLFK